MSCAGIRAVPNLGNTGFTNLANLAVLRYLGAPSGNPTVDPTTIIPISVLPLNETDLHVGFLRLLSPNCADGSCLATRFNPSGKSKLFVCLRYEFTSVRLSLADPFLAALTSTLNLLLIW